MNTKDILFYFMIGVIVGLSIYLIWFTKSESYQCMSTPLQYGLSKYTPEVTCTCYAVGIREPFYATKYNLTSRQSENTGLPNNYKLNLS